MSLCHPLDACGPRASGDNHQIELSHAIPVAQSTPCDRQEVAVFIDTIHKLDFHGGSYPAARMAVGPTASPRFDNYGKPLRNLSFLDGPGVFVGQSQSLPDPHLSDGTGYG